MKTHIDLDEVLLDQVIELGKFPTKKAAVHEALSEFIKILKRRQLLALKGQVAWQGDLEQLRAPRNPRNL